MIRTFVAATLTLGLATLLTLPVAAIMPSPETQAVSPSEAVESTKEDLKRRLENTVQRTTDETRRSIKEDIRSQKEQIQERKDQLLAEQQQRIDERKTKLEGRRLAQCQNRQDKINQLIDKSVTFGRERLARIQRFEDSIQTFYSAQALTSERYDSAVLAADESEAAAIAALDAFAAQDFDCTKVDGTDTSGTIRVSHESKRAALDAYRASVKELVLIVKEAYVAKQASAGAEQ